MSRPSSANLTAKARQERYRNKSRDWQQKEHIASGQGNVANDQIKIMEASEEKLRRRYAKNERLHSADSDEGMDILNDIEKALVFRRLGKSESKRNPMNVGVRSQTEMFGKNMGQQWTMYQQTIICMLR